MASDAKIKKPKVKNDIKNFTEGKLFLPLVVFTLPVLASGVLQFLYNAADVFVIGKFVGDEALAAVGSTGSLSNLLTGLFIGFSVGASVAVSQYIGSGELEDARQTVHTSMLLSLVLGVIISIIGYNISRPLLILMDSPKDDVLPLATQYIKIIFLGMPAQMVYNYGASILRAKGDTKNPLIFLTISGVLNVVLNLFFVIKCGMGVAGVAWATIISQYLSAVLVTVLLCRLKDACRLNFKELRIHPDKLRKIVTIGFPAGIQSILFSISNILIQSSINSFGKVAIAGNTAASNVDGLIYIACNSFYHAALTFTGQNMGAGKFGRVKKTCAMCLLLVTVIGLAISGVCWVFGDELLALFSDTPNVGEYGKIRLLYVGMPYFLCGIMEVMSGMLRGLGASTVSTVVSLLGACAFRIVWIAFVFGAYHTTEVLYLSYPVSWIITSAGLFVCYLIVLRRREKQAASAAALSDVKC